MVKRIVAAFAVLAAVGMAVPASAQTWRGQGRVAGKVMDESRQPLDGVTVKLFLPSGNGGFEVKTNKKGDWSAGGIASGAWQVDSIKEGYETRRITADIEQLNPKPPMEIIMKKAAPDPNQLVAAEMKKASTLVAEKKFDEAQAIYADLLAKYPQAYQIQLSIARAYHAEGKHDREIEAFKKWPTKKMPD